MEPISAIIGLINTIPKLAKIFKNKDSSGKDKLIQVVGSVAQEFTGETSPAKAVEAIAADPHTALEFEKAVMADKHVRAQLSLENSKDARKMYTASKEFADKLAFFTVKSGLFAIVGMIIMQIGAYYVLKDDSMLIAIVSNLIGAAIGTIGSWIGQILGFYFGGVVKDSNDNEFNFRGEDHGRD